MVEREKQDKTKVSRMIEQRQIVALCVMHACTRHFLFCFLEKSSVAWRLDAML